MPLVKECCGCNLKTGTLIIVILGLVILIIRMLFLLYLYAHLKVEYIRVEVNDTRSRPHEEKEHKHKRNKHMKVEANVSKSHEEKEHKSNNTYVYYGYRSMDTSHIHMDKTAYYGIGYIVVCFIVSLLLVVGIFMKQSAFFIPYLIFACLDAIICLIVTVTLLVHTFTKSKHEVFGLTCVMMLGISMIVWYAWLCVFSFYKITGEGVRQDGIPPVYYSAPGNYPQQANYPPATMPPPAYQEKSQFGLA